MFPDVTEVSSTINLRDSFALSVPLLPHGVPPMFRLVWDFSRCQRCRWMMMI